MEIDTALCPVREADMSPYEILLSESQERMLVIGHKGQFEPIRAIAEKWELEAALIGSVTDDGMFRVKHNGTIVVEIPGTDLVDEAPVYHPEGTESDASIARRASGGSLMADLTHFDDQGRAHMVDVSAKDVTDGREATDGLWGAGKPAPLLLITIRPGVELIQSLDVV